MLQVARSAARCAARSKAPVLSLAANRASCAATVRTSAPMLRQHLYSPVGSQPLTTLPARAPTLSPYHRLVLRPAVQAQTRVSPMIQPLLHGGHVPHRTLFPALLARLGLAGGAAAAVGGGLFKRRGLALLAIGTGAYIVATGAVYVAEGMFNVSFADVGVFAFSLGVAMGAATAGGAVYLTRVMSVRPEPIYRLTLKRVRADSAVAASIGRNIRPDAFRAYSLVRDEDSAGVVVRAVSRAMSAIVPEAGFHRRVQLVFQITGRRDTGIVHADVRRVRGGYEYLNLSVHVPRTAATIVLAGSGKPLTHGAGLMSISSPSSSSA